jgi:Leucine-rich repeat (LRR) protein
MLRRLCLKINTDKKLYSTIASSYKAFTTYFQVLVFSNNKLSHLSAYVFAHVHLTNLQRIRLNDCRLKSIDDRAFANLSNLMDLDLSDNMLTSVPTVALSAVPSLRELSLSGNMLPVVANKAFAGVGQLVRLELARCNLTDVQAGAFQELKHLKTLKLNSNRQVYTDILLNTWLQRIFFIYFEELP